MRLSRARAAVVLFVALLHVGSGAVAAIGACCAIESHDAHGGSGAKLMECCLKGGPNHICPFMSKSRRAKSPGTIEVYCPTGHDTGVPVTGFAAVTPVPGAVALPPVAPLVLETPAEQTLARVVHPPTPPPRHHLL